MLHILGNVCFDMDKIIYKSDYTKICSKAYHNKYNAITKFVDALSNRLNAQSSRYARDVERYDIFAINTNVNDFGLRKEIKVRYLSNITERQVDELREIIINTAIKCIKEACLDVDSDLLFKYDETDSPAVTLQVIEDELSSIQNWWLKL